MLQIRELLWGLLLIGCAGKKRSWSSVVWDAGSSAGVELRDTEAEPRGSWSSILWLAASLRPIPDSALALQFQPDQTNFSGVLSLFMRQIAACAPPGAVPHRRRILCACAASVARPAARITATLDFCVVWLTFYTHAARRWRQVEVMQRQSGSAALSCCRITNMTSYCAACVAVHGSRLRGMCQPGDGAVGAPLAERAAAFRSLRRRKNKTAGCLCSGWNSDPVLTNTRSKCCLRAGRGSVSTRCCEPAQPGGARFSSSAFLAQTNNSSA